MEIYQFQSKSYDAQDSCSADEQVHGVFALEQSLERRRIAGQEDRQCAVRSSQTAAAEDHTHQNQSILVVDIDHDECDDHQQHQVEIGMTPENYTGNIIS
jgi:hypothetical protein